MKITKEQSFEENRKFLGFIKECPTSYQTVNTLRKYLMKQVLSRKKSGNTAFGTRMMHLEAMMENIRGML